MRLRKVLFLLATLIFISTSCNKSTEKQTTQNATTSPVADNATSTTPISPTLSPELSMPINGGLSRVTKKPFGIYITPKTSPVQPEKFMGYHTGIDFETTPAEANIDVSIFAACNGKLLLKKYATGYGGVAVQSCILDGKPVTIIYGHLRLSSITNNVGDQLKAGDKIALLGTGYSTDTDGERKHLHFGIHIGASINILGYVQKQSDLSAWMDPAQYIK